MRMVVIFGSHLLCVTWYYEVVDQLPIMIHQRRVDNNQRAPDLWKVPKPVVNESPSNQLLSWYVRMLDPTRWQWTLTTPESKP
jgi:hypothetical protein